jgi:hypothetical protein
MWERFVLVVNAGLWAVAGLWLLYATVVHIRNGFIWFFRPNEKLSTWVRALIADALITLVIEGGCLTLLYITGGLP